MAKVVITKLNPKPLALEVTEFIIPLADRQLFYLSQETVNEIRNRISESIKREGSTGKLASSFIAEKIASGYGIGNINYLNQHAPYWYWQNYGVAQSGRRVPPPTVGRFEGNPEYPSAESSTQKWLSKQGRYYMTPIKPIQAKNYIEKTIAKIPGLVNQVLNTVK